MRESTIDRDVRRGIRKMHRSVTTKKKGDMFVRCDTGKHGNLHMLTDIAFVRQDAKRDRGPRWRWIVDGFFKCQQSFKGCPFTIQPAFEYADSAFLDDEGYPSVDENGSTLVPVPRDGPLDEAEASSLSAWAQGYGRSGKICEIPSLDGVITNPSQFASKRRCAKRCSQKKTTETRSTPFREKAKEHGTERITGAELRKRTRCHRCQQLGHLARECQNQAPKDNPQAPTKSFSMAGDAIVQLHNLVSYMAFTGVSEPLDESPDGFENEAGWYASNDEPDQRHDTSKPKHHNFVGLNLGPARGLTDSAVQQPVVGTSAAQWWCERLCKRHGLVPVDVTPNNMTATCGGIGSVKGVRVLDFPGGIVGVSGVMRLLVLEEPVSTDGKQQFTPPLTPFTLMRQLGANI